MQSPAGTQPTAVTREMPQITAETNSLPPARSMVGPTGDSCPSCGSAMATDQRYCVDCGERRGEPRLPMMDGRGAAAPAAQAAAPAAYPPPLPTPPPRNKWGASIALLSTIALLLLAMGVGVLIGNNGDEKSTAAQQPVIIGGAAGVTAATGATDATAAADASKKDSAAAATSDKASVDADAVAKQNGVKLAPKDVGVGDKCAKDSVGCSDSGEFDGNYFGE